MASIIPDYNYDIFISYRQKDNKYDGWVTEFVDNINRELEATFKEEVGVYFDINPHDGLLETHDVDESLKEKLKCLVFIPIISRTYCDPKSFAWEHELKAFIDIASNDKYGLKIQLHGGNIASRILPVRIHDLDQEDLRLCESVMGGYLRGIEFVYKSAGVNRPLTPTDNPDKNLNNTFYRDQINKVALAIKDLIRGMKSPAPDEPGEETTIKEESEIKEDRKEEKTAVGLKHNLPAQLTTFIGREKETAELLSLVENSRLVTITGAGGCGKTRILLHIAKEFLDKFTDGVWFVDLSPLEDPELLPQEVANTLSIIGEPGKPIISTLKEQIREKNCLLLLDNCEHLVDATADLAQQLLSGSPHIKLLATSREALKINGEVLWRVPSLSLPEEGEEANLEKIRHSEAIQLFLDRARNSKPGFQLDGQNAHVISQICHHLDGIPLAIEMAAARIRHMDAKMILERIRNRFHLLSTDRRTSISRQKTLKTTLDWSYDLLLEKEKLLFARLSVFAGGFLAESAEEVCSDDRLDKAEVLDTLSNLVDKSMVVIKSRQGGSVRYGMLETLKEYAAEKLSVAGEKETMDNRHYDFYLSMLDRAFEERLDHGFEWAERIEADHDEYLKAAGWAENKPELFMKICGGLGWFWEARSYFGLGVQKLKQALDGYRDKSAYTARTLLGYILFAQWNYDNKEENVSSFNEALSIWTALGNKPETGHLHNWFGNLQAMNNELESAIHHFQEAFSIFDSLGDLRSLVLTKFGLGFVYVCSLEPEKAEPFIEEALAGAIKFGMKREIGFARHVHADCALLRKDYPESLRRYKIALKACMEARDQGQAISELFGIALSMAGLAFFREALILHGLIMYLYKQLGIFEAIETWPAFWIHCMEETIEKAKKEVGEELARQYEEEGIAMGFEKAVEYALDFEKNL